MVHASAIENKVIVCLKGLTFNSVENLDVSSFDFWNQSKPVNIGCRGAKKVKRRTAICRRKA